MNFFDWIIIVFYIAGMIGMSMYLGKKQKTIRDYYVGGNNLPWWAIGLSTMATQCSTNSFLGTPAFVAIGLAGGLIFLQTELALPLAMIFIMIFFLPFFRKANVISVYEYLEKRFGVKTRTLLSILFQTSRALATGVTVYSVSMVLEIALGIPLWLSVALIGVVTIIYDTLGGMEAVVYSDVIQMVILYAGVLLCIGYGLHVAGGIDAVVDIYSKDRLVIGNEREAVIYDLSKTEKPQASLVENKNVVLVGLKQRFEVLMFRAFGFKKGEDFSFWAVLIGFFFLYCSYYGCDQSQVQRELSSKNMDDTNLSLFLNGITRFFLASSLALMGLCIGAALLRDIADPKNAEFLFQILDEPKKQNQMAIYFILKYLPHGVIGLIVVSIFSAAMSSLDSAINSLSATTMRDIYQRFINPDPSESKHLLWSKGTTVGWGVVCTISAFLTPYFGENVMIAINKIGSLTYGPILATFMLAILTRRANDKGTLIGIPIGVVFNMLLWRFTDISWLWWNLTGCVVTFSVGYLASLCFEKPTEEKLVGLVYCKGVAKQFDYQRNWSVYYIVLVGFFAFFLGLCFLIQNIPTIFP